MRTAVKLLVLSCVCFLVFVTDQLKAQNLFCKKTVLPWMSMQGSLAVTNDGGCITAFSTRVFSTTGDFDVIITKFDSTYLQQWSLVYQDSAAEGQALSIIQTFDGGYAVSGLNRPQGQNSNAFVLKLDVMGNIQWCKVMEGSGIETGFQVLQANDSSLIIIGHTTTFGLGGGDAYVVKLDVNGNLIWARTVGVSAATEIGMKAVLTPDNQIVVCGVSGTKGLLFKIDLANGTLTWSKIYYSNHAFSLTGIALANDGGFMLGGFSRDSVLHHRNLLAKADSTGSLSWVKITGYDYQDRITNISRSHDGYYYGCGYCIYDTTGFVDQYVERIFKWNENGNMLWSKAMNNSCEVDEGNIVETANGKLLVTFGTYVDISLSSLDTNGNGCCTFDLVTPESPLSWTEISSGSLDSGVIFVQKNLVRFDGGTWTTDCIISSVQDNDQANYGVTIYPNPASDILKIDLNGKYNEINFEITDAAGRKINNYSIKSSTEININHLSPGIYFYSFNSEKKRIGAGNFVKE